MEKILEIVKIKQVVKENEHGLELTRIRSPKDGADIAYQFIGDDDREVFFVMCLNTKNEVNAVHRCHVGDLSSSIVNVREVFKSAILNNSRSIIVCHQHPSGDVHQSPEDVQVTKRLVEAGKILGIDVLDSLIINYKGDFLSLKEKGYIN